MQFICEVGDVGEGKARGFDIDGRAIFVVNKDGELYTYLNSCPHLGIELEYREDDFLDDDGRLIQCSTHGALFTIESGECISGPCWGDHLRAADTKIEAGKLYLISLRRTGPP